MARPPQVRKARDWCFTIQLDPRDEWQSFWDELSTSLDGEFKYLVGQVEAGSHHHFQGFIQWHSPRRLDTCRRACVFFERAHFEPRRGTAIECDAYCRKADTRIAGPWSSGQLSSQGVAGGVSDLVQAIDTGASLGDVIRADPRTAARCINLLKEVRATRKRERDIGPRIVHVFTGATGTGKTRAVYDAHPPDQIYSVAGYKPLWFDGYNDEPVILLDEFDGTMDISMLLKVLDRMEYALRVPIKGGFAEAAWKEVYICSNLGPEMWYPQATPSQYAALERRFTDVRLF